jgi:aryl-alcohol dehydrogenase-like predicted oxidoreductase
MTSLRKLGSSDLEVFPLALGGNVFGWTADQAGSFAVLDAYTAVGGNFVDTADTYSSWAPGNEGGESETVIGDWLTARGNRADVPYSGLAAGFLTGKYRPGGAEVDSPRAGSAGRHLESERGQRVLAALDEVAQEHGAELATVALAWLASRPTIAVPLASARTVAQLPALLEVADLALTDADLAKLTAASG